MSPAVHNLLVITAMIIRVRRPLLRATILRLQQRWSEMAAAFERQMQTAPRAKPAQRQGGSETDEFNVELRRDQIEQIVEVLGDTEGSLAESGAPTFRVSATADLLDYWNAHLFGLGRPN